MQYLQHLAGRISRRAVDFVLPPRCIATGLPVDQQGMISSSFWHQLHFIADPVCTCCGYPFEINMKINGGILCGGCLQNKPAFNRARAALAYDDASRDLILKFKHGDMMHAVDTFLPWLMRAGEDLISQADILLPVPLHRFRLISRRYNQAALLAQAVARKAGKPCIADGLIRNRATDSQGRKKAAERRQNVKNAFAIHPKHGSRLKGKNILLIDDVHTTGATVGECAHTLIKAGAADVNVLTLARVVRPS